MVRGDRREIGRGRTTDGAGILGGDGREEACSHVLLFLAGIATDRCISPRKRASTTAPCASYPRQRLYPTGLLGSSVICEAGILSRALGKHHEAIVGTGSRTNAIIGMRPMARPRFTSQNTPPSCPRRRSGERSLVVREMLRRRRCCWWRACRWSRSGSGRARRQGCQRGWVRDPVRAAAGRRRPR